MVECLECKKLGRPNQMLKWCKDCQGYHHTENWEEEHREHITIRLRDWEDLPERILGE